MNSPRLLARSRTVIDIPAIQIAIEQAFATRRPAVPSIEDTQFDGMGYKPTPGVPWVRLHIEFDDVERETMNGREEVGQTTMGAVNLAYFAPINSGWLAPQTWMTEALKIFNEARIPVGGSTKSFIVFDSPLSRGVSHEEPWSIYEYTITFQAYQNPTD